MLKEPELLDMGSDFRVNLYRNPAAADQNIWKNPEVSGELKLSDSEMIVVLCINENKECTSQQIAQRLNTTDRYARMILGEMVAKRILQKTGRARNTACVAGELYPTVL